MALEDLKSNLNIGAGKPKSSPSGRHTESPSILGKIDNQLRRNRWIRKITN